MNWFLAALKKYADFSGRAQRSEYWYFFLFYLLIYIALAIVDSLMGSLDENTGIGILTGIFTLAMLIPSISVGVRRLHDTDRSGWWMLIGLIPIIGGVVLLVFCVQDSQATDNRFGSNPKIATKLDF
jgi:uncharacterized membrane protein YhaH (DUF805 family)